MKPLQQLLGLAVEDIWKVKNQSNNIYHYRNNLRKIKEQSKDNLEEYAKKKEKYCSQQIQQLLFEKYLIKIKNQKNGLQSIQSFFR
jgi:vacuolar-type H+-ATPase subunit I/STV1